MGQRILHRTLEWEKMQVKEKNVGLFLKIYLRENLVLIKKITACRTTYFTYGHVVNAYSDVGPIIHWI